MWGKPSIRPPQGTLAHISQMQRSLASNEVIGDLVDWQLLPGLPDEGLEVPFLSFPKF
jgi:hypothetical protein